MTVPPAPSVCLFVLLFSNPVAEVTWTVLCSSSKHLCSSCPSVAPPGQVIHLFCSRRVQSCRVCLAVAIHLFCSRRVQSCKVCLAVIIHLFCSRRVQSCRVCLAVAIHLFCSRRVQSCRTCLAVCSLFSLIALAQSGGDTSTLHDKCWLSLLCPV